MNKQVKQIRDEIERLQRWSIDTFTHHGGISTAVVHVLTDLLDFIDSIEEPEVDLEKECKIYLKNNFTSKEVPDEFLTTQMQLDDMVLFAKHFYELGLARK